MFVPPLVLPKTIIKKMGTALTDFTYRPPEVMKSALGKVMDMFDRGQVKIAPSKPVPAKFSGFLPKGQLYFDSQLALDTDGYTAGDDRNHDSKTSLPWPDGRSINAN
jgi:hypothetical protein